MKSQIKIQTIQVHNTIHISKKCINIGFFQLKEKNWPPKIELGRINYLPIQYACYTMQFLRDNASELYLYLPKRKKDFILVIKKKTISLLINENCVCWCFTKEFYIAGQVYQILTFKAHFTYVKYGKQSIKFQHKKKKFGIKLFGAKM